MRSILTRLASLELTLVGILGVITFSFVYNRMPEISTSWIVVPLVLLSINLLAAILTNGAFRKQAALLVFHVCLLAVITLIGIGVMIRFDGHVEVVERERFDAANVQISEMGMFHRMNLDAVAFTQRDVEVAYQPGLIRRSIRSEVIDHRETDDNRLITIGDRVSATFIDYRFVTTFNKGYAIVVLWSGSNGELQRGSINFPSFPEFEWKQINAWTTPGGDQLLLELSLDAAAPRDEAWLLNSKNVQFAVDISGNELASHTLQPGDSVQIGGGTLKIEDLRMWMGYRIDFNPLLPWIFAAAMLALIALAVHFQINFWPARRMAGSAAPGGIRAYDGCD